LQLSSDSANLFKVAISPSARCGSLLASQSDRRLA
jgi:hypothetical protein